MSFAEPDALWLLALAPLAAASATWLWRRRITDVRAWAAPALWTRLNLAISRGTLIASLATLTVVMRVAPYYGCLLLRPKDEIPHGDRQESGAANGGGDAG